MRIATESELDKNLSDQIGGLAAQLLLIPRSGSDLPALPFDWVKAKQYYSAYCQVGGGNDCPDNEFPEDCTHFVSHGLSKSAILVNLPSVTCANGVCIRVAELAAAFKNSVNKYSNVRRVSNLADTKEGDYCFVVSWFGLSKDHAMVLAGKIDATGGKVWGHTNHRCAQPVDLTGQTLVIYRIQ